MKKTKDHKSVLVHYISELNDSELRYLGSRLNEKYSGDLADAMDFMADNQQIDDILGAANSANELFSLCDVIGNLCRAEAVKRNMSLFSTPKEDKKKNRS